MIDLLEEQIINNIFDLATDEEVKDWYCDNATYVPFKFGGLSRDFSGSNKWKIKRGGSMSRSYPVWNIINSCAYSRNKSYGIREHGEVEVRVGSSSRNSHFFLRDKNDSQKI